ncbi:MAG TPA: GMC family oxidoreductase [Vicinamibacterales bacterium]|jgi:gluconate 2-dehydrogenase alpha chain|nr:GMC family oxidoreductase [Vicinamibacterales bacterium]
MATNLRRTDVVIIGLGATGGVAALPLAQAGLDVVGLEAGTWLAPADLSPDELRNNFRGWPQTVQKANREVPTHRPNASAPYSPRPAIHPMMNAVGGTTLHYWAQSWRLNPWDFKVVSDTRRRYGAAKLPKGTTVEDWPFGLEELEPYYDKVEVEIGVSGQAGNVGGKIDPRGNIFEGPRARAYPMPPLRGTGFTEMMAGAARSLGWHPFPGPAAITSGRYEGRSGCVYHGFCNRGGCHVSAKGSTAVTTIPKAQRTKRLTVVTEAHVTSIDVDAQGRVGGVTYRKGSEEFFQPASVVLLASYTYENVRLLLLSTSKAFPKGLSNNHGQVGRHYFSHNQIATVNALFPRNLNTWYGLPAQGIAVDDWADDNFDHGALDFIGGGNLWIYSDRRPIAAANMSTFGRAPRWGAQWKAFIRENADRGNTAYLQRTTLPYEDNYLDLDPAVKDPLGFPVCRITADYKENERRLADFTQDKMTQWYRAAGAVATQKTPVGTMGPTTHAYGGTRMGDNPETNVVDRWGFAHEVPNLGILGASVMGTSGARNPTLTAQALAWRTAEHLAANWKSIAT